MGTDVESSPDMKIDPSGIVVGRNGCPRFSEMGDWFFWTHSSCLGFSDAEAMCRVSDEVLSFRMQMAMNRLRDADVPGVQWWMDNRRRMT